MQLHSHHTYPLGSTPFRIKVQMSNFKNSSHKLGVLQRAFPLWLLGGDFNMITNIQENKGGRMHLDLDSNGFKKFIHGNHLIDLQTSNGIFTWNKKRGGAHQIASRLDRFLITEDLI